MADFSNGVRSAATSEQFPKLQGALDGVADLLNKLNVEFDRVMNKRINDIVIAKLGEMDTMCVEPMRQVIKDNDKCLKELKTASDAYDKATQKMSKPDAIAKLDATLVDARKKLANSEGSLEENIKKFETQRILDLRDVLLSYLTSQMYYHSKGLEFLSQAHDLLINISPDEGRAALSTTLDKLAIATVGATKK